SPWCERRLRRLGGRRQPRPRHRGAARRRRRHRTAAVAGALRRSRSLVLLLSPSDRQSGELAAKVFGYYGALGQPIGSCKRTELQLHLVNGGRVIALPKNQKTIRGFLGARRLVVVVPGGVSALLHSSVGLL